MDEQKKIEEMVRIMFEKAFENYETSGSVEIDTEVRRNFYSAFLLYCASLYNAGYRKIPENAVVLTREEYEKLGLVVETVQEYESQNGQPVLVKEKKVVKKLQTDFVDLLNREIRELQISQQARKETAEICYKIFKFYKENCYDIPLDLVARDIKEKCEIDFEVE